MMTSQTPKTELPCKFDEPILSITWNMDNCQNYTTM